ncbi:MAG: DNA helicase RecG, partial [Acidimicrobiales bacterium]|nr:DNA helicase RecG [Acidimicrobiales bacterium]
MAGGAGGGPGGGGSGGPITYAELAGYPISAIKALADRPKKAAALGRLGVTDVLALLTYYPRRHVDRSRQLPIRELRPGDEAMVVAMVRRVSSRRTRGRPSRLLVTVDVTDDSGGSLRLSFFNQYWVEKRLSSGTQAVFFGKVDTYQGRLQMSSPVVDVIGDQTGRIISLYPQSEKESIKSEEVADWVGAALEKTRRRGIDDPVPGEHLREWGLVPRGDALWGFHRPSEWAEIERSRQRLVFDELLRVQLALVLRKRALEQTAKGI